MPWIEKCLSSVMNSGMKTDIMVVDNCSTDATVETIKTSYPEVRLIENRENLGFGAANNQGINIAVEEGYDGVLLLNQDAWIFNDTLALLVETAMSNPSAGIVSPVHMNGSNTDMDWGFRNYVGTEAVTSLPSEAFEVDFINAAIWYVPIETFRRIGMFAPMFYHYGEDKDLVNRLHYHGLKVFVEPRSKACHDREKRSVSNEQFVHSEYVYHLTRLTDVNGGSWGANSLLVNSAQILQKSMKQLMKGHFKVGASMLGLIPKLCQKKGEACRHRMHYSTKKKFI